VCERESVGCAGGVRGGCGGLGLGSWVLGIERLDDLNLNQFFFFYFNDIFISIAFT
jgi:hypothetical protein